MGAYFKYMNDIAGLLGGDSDVSNEEMKRVLEFEAKLANVSVKRYYQGLMKKANLTKNSDAIKNGLQYSSLIVSP